MNLLGDNETTAPAEWLLERMRLHRDRLLAQSDWTQLPDSSADRETWAVYRQELRDFPKTWTPATTVELPKTP